MALTATFVKNANRPGRYGDGRGGRGLALVVKSRAGGGLSKSWVQTIRVRGDRTNIGLGVWPEVSLADAREKALANSQMISRGGDPRRRIQAVPTFQEALEEVIKGRGESWRAGGKSEKQWRASLETYAGALCPRLVTDITKRDVIGVLEPIWVNRRETARRVRSRISIVMDWAIGKEYREDNPARRAIIQSLPPQTDVKQSQASVPHPQVAAALAVVEASRASSSTKLCLRFQTLTASRPTEARACRWEEIDFKTATWTIPGERTKKKRPHRVPLSTQALELLQKAQELSGGSAWVFPAPRREGPLSDTINKLLRSRDLEGTPHGMRSSFSSWCSDMGHPLEVAEHALGHIVRGVAGAYQRSDLFDRRRPVMQDWADYLDSEG